MMQVIFGVEKFNMAQVLFFFLANCGKWIEVNPGSLNDCDGQHLAYLQVHLIYDRSMFLILIFELSAHSLAESYSYAIMMPSKMTCTNHMRLLRH